MDNIDRIKKLEEIDKLLEEDVNLEIYIKNIEEKQIKTPIELKEKIITKVNKKKRVLYVDICKIVACLIFSLAICRTDFIKNDNILRYKDNKPNTSIINEKLSDFCKWFTTPTEIEKEEK